MSGVVPGRSNAEGQTSNWQPAIINAMKEGFMFNVCPKCGEYSVEKPIDASGPFAICPFCGYAHPFLQLPLFIITGSSGSGKTTICLELIPLVQECVILESDILWGAFPADPEN